MAIASNDRFTMNNGSKHDDLLRQMAGARAALSSNAQSAVDNARTLADWKYHYRNHPWLFCGVAAAVGYLLVPQPKLSRPTTESDEEATSAATRSGVAAGLLTTAAGLIIRQSLPFLIRRGFQWIDARTAPASEANGSQANDIPQS
jgi:hypothetical protein